MLKNEMQNNNISFILILLGEIIIKTIRWLLYKDYDFWITLLLNTLSLFCRHLLVPYGDNIENFKIIWD